MQLYYTNRCHLALLLQINCNPLVIIETTSTISNTARSTPNTTAISQLLSLEDSIIAAGLSKITTNNTTIIVYSFLYNNRMLD